MLVEFQRTQYNEEPGSGEDDQFVNRTFLPIWINPAKVGAVFSSVDPEVTIVRMADGRGFKVRGEVRAVAEKLEANGHLDQSDE